MTKRLSLLALVLAFGAFTVGAHAACPGSTDLALLLAPVDVTSELDVSPEIVFASADRGGNGSYTKATCSASCGSYNVTCSYTPPSICIAVDRNCPSQVGYVTCNGVTTYCSPSTCNPPPECAEGTQRYMWYGNCCGSKRENEQEQCMDGAWVPTGVYRCIGPCPIEP